MLARLIVMLYGRIEERGPFEGPVDSIIIIAQEKLGDAILLTPLLRNLRRALPHAEIHVAAMRRNIHFFESDTNVDAVYRLKPNYISYFRALRKKRFDLLFNTKDHPSFTYLAQSRFIRARYRVGIYHPGHEGFFNHLIRMDHFRHIIEKNCRLLDFLGIPYDEEDTRPSLPQGRISREMSTFLSDISGTEFLAANLSAGDRNREWPLEMWIDLLGRLERKVIILSTPDRVGDKRALEEMFDHVLPSPPTRSIFEAGEIIKHARLLISPDTSLIHAASCTATPVVGLYRADPNHTRRFYPYLVPNQSLVSTTDCISDIPVGDALDAVGAMWK